VKRAPAWSLTLLKKKKNVLLLVSSERLVGCHNGTSSGRGHLAKMGRGGEVKVIGGCPMASLWGIWKKGLMDTGFSYVIKTKLGGGKKPCEREKRMGLPVKGR